MKIRQGFVSNSSSSSFIAIGIFCDKDELTEEELEESHSFEGEEDRLIGEYFDIDGYGIDSIALSEVIETAKKVSTKYNIDLDDIEIIYGSYYS